MSYAEPHDENEYIPVLPAVKCHQFSGAGFPAVLMAPLALVSPVAGVLHTSSSTMSGGPQSIVIVYLKRRRNNSKEACGCL